MGQILCVAGFLDTNNKRIDRSIVSMLRSMFGGDEEDRTLDLTDANRTLSQLSYAPKLIYSVAQLDETTPPS